MQDFKHIEAWRRGRALAIAITRATEDYGRRGYGYLRIQLVKAADAISANIAEGCGAATNKEFARFLDISIKSANETEHRLLDARDLGLMPQDEWERFTAETIEVRKMTYGYRKKVLENDLKNRTKKQRKKKSPDT